MKSVVFVILAVSAQAAPPPGLGPTPLPAQCHNEILHLSPIRYIAAGLNYSNCELKGQVGTVIQGTISLVRYPWHNNTIWGLNSLVLSGTMVLDQMSLASSGATLHIKGDEIIVKDTHIEDDWAGTLAVDGGRASFESTRLSCDISLTNATVTFSNTSSTCNSYDCKGTHISHSNVSMMKSSFGQSDVGEIEIVASILDLTDSNLTTSHGSVSLRNSNATFLRSTVILKMGMQSMNIEKSSVVADCGSEEAAVFMIGNGADGPGVHVDSSQLTFHASCDLGPPTATWDRCDMSRAISVGIGRAPISIDESSVHFEPCIPSKEARSVLV
jgi:hypothetical protein